MTLRAALAHPPRYAALAAGALPVLAFPGAGFAALAWVALVPGFELIRRAPSGREAAVRGWWFGAGFILVAMYWLVPSIGPALALLALVFGALQAPVGLALWRLLHGQPTGRRAAAALVLVPAVWVSTEYLRSWAALGGPWALLGASQWQHPAVLALASVGGAWLVGFAVVAANVGVLILLTGGRPLVRAAGATATAVSLLAGPVLFALRTQPSDAGTAAVALVQPGVIDGEDARLDAGLRLTDQLTGQLSGQLGGRPVDLVVWGESSVGADLDRDSAALARLRTAAARSGAELLAGEDARKADGRISKDAVLITPEGIQDRYRKIRLVPFGEYIPLRPVLGWLAGVSKAAGENRAPGSSFHLLPLAGRDGRPLPAGVLICFESAFPDMSRAAADQGARLLVYQSATSTFQDSWAPAQHASLGALRAAETGRPVVQAALTGESVAFDRQGRRLADLPTSATGTLTVRLPLAAPAARTVYDRVGDVVPRASVALTVLAGAAALWRGKRAAGAVPPAAPAQPRRLSGV